ncbi:pseudaminic acid biosynthesis-associated methylase [Domibacillus epiphyticus]|uniref:Pseudaminic acid biosynthesis-associated methylase n=1 Tax=Domibacillus epiphyticus TaxID=1714355 RepID=A0A1V2A459_9BACI|nr:pseudaminic acid biosynthesis-associated methylase [Domibacillus epiphyticus]OMP65789.1 pseudaminic acid biosynthesis-associated methylase [Domibacillus epiphyticus]
MTQYKTEQEKFWAEEFGNEYIKRNKNFSTNIPLFSRILNRTNQVKSILEFGSNIGLNLKAIRAILPEAKLSAIEINPVAAKHLEQIGNLEIYNQSILDFEVDYKRDFVLIKGVLIHINPDFLNDVYELLYNASDKYICISEYYNPTPVELHYRGHEGKLFKRDFAGEMLDKYPNLDLVDYGFVYHKDKNFPQDDTTWFLLEKK